MTHRARTGITAIELVVALTISALLLVFGIQTSSAEASAGRAARDVATTVRAARWAAVSEGRPVVLLAAADGSLVRTLEPGFGCRTESGFRVMWERRPGVVLDWPTRGIAFAPDGRPRRCDGSGAGNTTVTVASRSGDRAAVIVSITGRIRWERR